MSFIWQFIDFSSFFHLMTLPSLKSSELSKWEMLSIFMVQQCTCQNHFHTIHWLEPSAMALHLSLAVCPGETEKQFGDQLVHLCHSQPSGHQMRFALLTQRTYLPRTQEILQTPCSHYTQFMLPGKGKSLVASLYHSLNPMSKLVRVDLWCLQPKMLPNKQLLETDFCWILNYLERFFISFACFFLNTNRLYLQRFWFNLTRWGLWHWCFLNIPQMSVMFMWDWEPFIYKKVEKTQLHV